MLQAIHIKNKRHCYMLCSALLRHMKPTPSLSCGFCHPNTVFMSTNIKISWKIATTKQAQSSTEYEVHSVLRCWWLPLYTSNNRRKYPFSKIGFRLKAAQVNVHAPLKTWSLSKLRSVLRLRGEDAFKIRTLLKNHEHFKCSLTFPSIYFFRA